MVRESTNYEDFKARLLTDPDVRQEYEALEPQFRLIKDILWRRSQLNLSQAQLAKLVGTRQPALSRLERGGGNITLSTLYRIASALDADLDISLKARSHSKV